MASDLLDMPLTATSLLAATPHSYILLDKNLVIQAASRAYLSMTGASEDDILGRPIFEAFPPNPDDPSNSMERVRTSMEVSLRDGVSDAIDVRYPIPDRNQPGRFSNRWWRISHSPLHDENGIVGVMQNSLDITETVNAARDADIRERLVDKLSDIAFWEFCPSRGTAIVSAAQSRMFGLPPAPGISSALPFIERYLPEDRARLIADFAALENADVGAEIDGEYRIQLPDGTIRSVLLQGDLVRENANEPASFVGVSMDITRAHDREAALAKTVKERDRLLEQKQLLLDEVNHRVKNSLQIVSSILNLDAQTAAGDEARTRLRGAAARVRAVASVHELIYKSGQVTTVEISSYLKDLCRSLESSAVGFVVCQIDPMVFSTDKAISMALLVNELVANAFEHAFNGRTDGRVDVISQSIDGDMVLTVMDNGNGKSSSSSKGLGTKVIAAMVMQLNGTLREGSCDDMAPLIPSQTDKSDASGSGHCVLVRIPLDSH
ncbi:MAG: histidine kinase dimerization/phosphoacceptor domain -containing protein [bacterium]